MTVHQQKQLRRTFFRNYSIDKISPFLIKINVVISSSDNICFHQYRIFGKSSKIITIVQIPLFSTKRPSFTQHIYSFHSPYIHLRFIVSSFILRYSFVFSSSARAARTVFSSSHFSITTLPLLGRGMGRGYFLRYSFVFTSL